MWGITSFSAASGSATSCSEVFSSRIEAVVQGFGIPIMALIRCSAIEDEVFSHHYRIRKDLHPGGLEVSSLHSLLPSW